MNPFDFDSLSAEDRALIEAELPNSLTVVVSLIGLKLTLALVEEFGGQRLIFPKSANGQGAATFAGFAQVVGVEATQMLGSYFGAEVFKVPLCTRLFVVIRSTSMKRDFDELLKVMSSSKAMNEIVRKYRLSWQHVFVIVNGKKGLVSPSKKVCTRNLGGLPDGLAWPDAETKFVSTGMAARLLGLDNSTVKQYCREGLFKDATRDKKIHSSPWQIPVSSLPRPDSQPPLR